MPICADEFYVPYRAHDVDHLTADGACLLGGQVTVIALLEADAYFVSGFHLETLESFLSLGNSNIVLRHSCFLLFLIS